MFREYVVWFRQNFGYSQFNGTFVSNHFPHYTPVWLFIKVIAKIHVFHVWFDLLKCLFILPVFTRTSDDDEVCICFFLGFVSHSAVQATDSWSPLLQLLYTCSVKRSAIYQFHPLFCLHVVHILLKSFVNNPFVIWCELIFPGNHFLLK